MNPFTQTSAPHRVPRMCIVNINPHFDSTKLTQEARYNKIYSVLHLNPSKLENFTLWTHS
jgi:hypothetical protein